MSLKKEIPYIDITSNLRKEEGMFKLYSLKGASSRHPNLKTAPFQTNQPHRHNFYEICVLSAGGGEHEIDFVKHPIHKQSIHLIFPGQVHHLDYDEGQGYILAFDQDFQQRYYSELHWLNQSAPVGVPQSSLVLDLDTEAFAEFERIVQEIEYEYLRQRSISLSVIGSFLYIFLLKLEFFCTAHYPHIYKSTAEEGILPHFRRLLERNYTQKHLVKEYAALLSLSTTRLNELIKQACGKSPSDLITERIMLEAKRLLTFSPQNNKEISFALGFEDPSYFSRFFRKNGGLSPRDFREKARKRYR